MTSKPMDSETEKLSEADEIAALLPWYVSGKISAADRAKVDAYAKLHPEVLGHIALARDEADVVFSDKSAIHVPRDALQRLQQSVSSSPTALLHGMKASLIDRIGVWLSELTPRQLAYAGTAAALAIAVQAASIGSLLSNQPSSTGYETASGPGSALGKGTFALVAFQPAAPQSTLTAFLASNNFVIVDGPKTGGIYRLRVSDAALSDADRDAVIAKLKARGDLVSFVSASGSAP